MIESCAGLIDYAVVVDSGSTDRTIDIVNATHEARAQGRVPGRKPKITAEQKKAIVEAVASGRKTPAEIARLLKIHRATVSRIVSQARARV
jgi:DNA invertase Pin-like site-specific DNA recombinase